LRRSLESAPSQWGHFNLSQSRRGGDRTIADRLTLLWEHRIGVERHIADLHSHLAALAQKIDLYKSLLDEHGGTDTM